jgi:uncharacterized Zn-binding protein involved in type VI secretion
MPGVAGKGDFISTGHLCDTTSTIGEGSSNVKVNGKPVAFKGAAISPHTIESQRGVQPPGPPTNPSTCIPHTASVKEGSSTVRVNGKPMARQYDAADDGSITQGSPNVNAN